MLQVLGMTLGCECALLYKPCETRPTLALKTSLSRQRKGAFIFNRTKGLKQELKETLKCKR